MSILNNTKKTSTPARTATPATPVDPDFLKKIRDTQYAAEDLAREADVMPSHSYRITAIQGDITPDQLHRLETLRDRVDTNALSEAARKLADDALALFRSLSGMTPEDFANDKDAQKDARELGYALENLQRKFGYARDDLAQLDAELTKHETAKAEAERKAKEEAEAAKKSPKKARSGDDADDDDDTHRDGTFDGVAYAYSEKFDDLPRRRQDALEDAWTRFQAARTANPSLWPIDKKSGRPLHYYQKIGARRFVVIDDMVDLDEEPNVAFGYVKDKKFTFVKNDVAEFIVQQLMGGADVDPW